MPLPCWWPPGCWSCLRRPRMRLRCIGRSLVPPGGEVVSQNFGSPTGGASRIDGPLGGTGWQCRTYTTSFTGYMRLASRRVGVPLKCEVWRGDLRMVWDRRPTAVGCYVLPSQGSRS